MPVYKVKKENGKARRQMGEEAGFLGAVNIAWLNHNYHMTAFNQKEIYVAKNKKKKVSRNGRKKNIILYICIYIKYICAKESV